MIADFQNAKNAEEQMEVHNRYYEVMKRVRTQRTLASTRFTLDTSDEFYSAENDYYDKEMPAYDTLLLAYKKLLLTSPYRAEFEEKIQVLFNNNTMYDSDIISNVLNYGNISAQANTETNTETNTEDNTNTTTNQNNTSEEQNGE